MIIKYVNQKKKLEQYVKGELIFTPQMNITMTDRTRKWFYEIGKYFVDLHDSKLPGELSWWNDKVSSGDVQAIEAVGMFVLANIDRDLMETMWGKPLKHRQFGEGASGRAKGFSSYFLEIDGKAFHIGYDHRGTTIEVVVGTTASEFFECIKMVMDEMKGNS